LILFIRETPRLKVTKACNVTKRRFAGSAQYNRITSEAPAWTHLLTLGSIHPPLREIATRLTAAGQQEIYGLPLVAAGCTVFNINPDPCTLTHRIDFVRTEPPCLSGYFA
jgi:hypothetical protein